MQRSYLYVSPPPRFPLSSLTSFHPPILIVCSFIKLPENIVPGCRGFVLFGQLWLTLALFVITKSIVITPFLLCR